MEVHLQNHPLSRQPSKVTRARRKQLRKYASWKLPPKHTQCTRNHKCNNPVEYLHLIFEMCGEKKTPKTHFLWATDREIVEILLVGIDLENLIPNSVRLPFYNILVRQVCRFYRNTSIKGDLPPAKASCSWDSQRCHRFSWCFFISSAHSP